MLNIAHIEPESFIYAPGNQFVIWMQGCPIRCKGCWNSDMWSFKPKQLISANDLINQISKIEQLSGVTFLGGEPFAQKNNLLDICVNIKLLGLGITIYTGYELEQLNCNVSKNILKYTDLLIYGPYIEELRNINLQWKGSENQEIMFISDYYSDYQIDNANHCEIKLCANGTINILGFPDNELVKELILNYD